MKKTSFIIALLAALSGPAFAQTAGTSGEKYPPPPKATGTAPVARETAKIPGTSGEKNPPPSKAAAAAPSETVQMKNELAAAKKDYNQKTAALKADYKAQKITKADYDAQRKALKAEDKAARAAIAKKYPNASTAEHGGG